MKSWYFFLTVSFATLLIGCGIKEKAKQASEAVDAVQNLEKVAENAQDVNNEVAKLTEERKKRGDTVAMHYDKLKTFLPSDLQGFKAEGDPKGEMVKQPGMSFSQIKQSYKNGDKTMEVSITDFNGVAALYTAAFGFFSGVEMENDQEILKGWDAKIANSKGYETFKKQSKDATATLGINGRFVVIVNASGQDNTDIVKNVAKSANLSEMSKL